VTPSAPNSRSTTIAMRRASFIIAAAVSSSASISVS